jgi:hypothetical protein
MRIEVRHVQVTRTALGDVALTIGDMQREGQYLSYKLFESHRNDSRTFNDIIENMTLCGRCGDGSKRPPNSGPAGHRQQRRLPAPWQPLLALTE